jgi:uncharacterized protein (DUF983 family)
MGRFFDFLLRGLFLRCPVCARGKIFAGVFKMHEYCPVCDFRFEREVGYFSSSMAINLVLSELVVTAVVLPLAANPEIPVFSTLLWCAPLTVILPLLFYRHSRSMWMSMDHYMNPPRSIPRPPTALPEPHEKH